MLINITIWKISIYFLNIVWENKWLDLNLIYSKYN